MSAVDLGTVQTFYCTVSCEATSFVQIIECTTSCFTTPLLYNPLFKKKITFQHPLNIQKVSGTWNSPYSLRNYEKYHS